MKIEQTAPNKPNFGLVVALSVIAALAIAAGALLFLNHGHFLGHHPHENPNAQLMPMTGTPPCMAA